MLAQASNNSHGVVELAGAEEDFKEAEIGGVVLVMEGFREAESGGLVCILGIGWWV